MTGQKRAIDTRDGLFIAFFCLVPLLPGLFVEGAFTGDAQIHWKWQYYFAGQFWRGELLPRWLVDLNNGFGSPAFFYYAPLTQWLTSLFAPLLPNPAQIPLRFVLTLMILSAIGGLGARAWIARLTGDRRAALLGALLYALLPYHAYVNVFQRGAFAELTAMALLPWIFDGASAVARERRFSIGFTLTLALLGISHAPSVLMVAPALAVYILGELRRAGWDWRLLAPYAASAICAGLMASFYLLPAFMLTGAIDTHALFGPYFDPTRWMILGPAWPNPGTSFYTHVVFLFYVAAGAIVGLLLWWRPDATGQRALIAFVVLMLLMTAVAQPFWAHAGIARKIQFPSRLLGLATLALSLAGGVALVPPAWRAGRWPRRPLALLAFGLVAGLLAVDGGFLGLRLIKARQAGKVLPGIAATLAEPVDQAEYRPGDVFAAADRLGTQRALLSPAAASPPGVAQWRPRHIVVTTDAAAPAILTIRQFRYTGWTAAIDGAAPVPARAEPVFPGLVAVALPPGAHRIAFTLEPTAWEVWGGRLSWLGVGLFAACAAGAIWRRRLRR